MSDVHARNVRELYLTTGPGLSMEVLGPTDDKSRAIYEWETMVRSRLGGIPKGQDIRPGKFHRSPDPTIYLVTVKHKNTLSHKGPMTGTTLDEAVTKLCEIYSRDESLVKDTAIVDRAIPIYRLWVVIGRASGKAGIVALWQLAASMQQEDLESC